MDACSNEEWARKLLSSFKDKRLEQLEKELAQDESLLALSARNDVLWGILVNGIPGELKNSWLRYEETGNQIICLTESFFYEKGFTDCLNLLRTIFMDINLPPGGGKI